MQQQYFSWMAWEDVAHRSSPRVRNSDAERLRSELRSEFRDELESIHATVTRMMMDVDKKVLELVGDLNEALAEWKAERDEIEYDRDPADWWKEGGPDPDD